MTRLAAILRALPEYIIELAVALGVAVFICRALL